MFRLASPFDEFCFAVWFVQVLCLMKLNSWRVLFTVMNNNNLNDFGRSTPCLGRLKMNYCRRACLWSEYLKVEQDSTALLT